MKRFYSVKEAAKILGVSTNTVYKYLDEGKLNSKRLGQGRFKIPASELSPFATHETAQRVISKISLKSTLSAFEGAGYEVKDFIFFKLFLAFIFLGTAILVSFHSGQLLPDYSRSLLLGDWYLTLTYILIPLTTFAAGALILCEIFLSQIFKKYEIHIHIFSAFVLLYCTFFALSFGKYEALIYFFTLLALVIAQLIRGLCVCDQKNSFEREYLKFNTISFSLAALLAFLKPEIVPFPGIRAFAASYPILFLASWILFIFLPILALAIPRFKHTNLDLIVLPILISFGIIFLVGFSAQAKWLPFYFDYVFVIFTIFLLGWRRFKTELTQRSASFMALGFVWSISVLLLGIFAVSLSQRFILNTRMEEMQEAASEISRGMISMFDSMDRRVEASLAEQEVVGLIESRNSEAITRKSKEIFDSIPNLRRVTILDRNGIDLGAYPRETLLQGTNLSSRVFYQEVKTTFRPFVSPVFTSVTGAQVAVKSYPVIYNDTFMGIINIAPDLDGLSQYYQNFFNGAKFYGFDSGGNYIFNPESEKIGKPVDKEILTEAKNGNFENIDVQRVFMPVNSIGWTIYLEDRPEDLFESLIAINAVVAIVILANSILAFSITFVLTKKWSKKS